MDLLFEFGRVPAAALRGSVSIEVTKAIKNSAAPASCIRLCGLLPVHAAEAGTGFGEVAAAATFGRRRRAPFPLCAWRPIAHQHDLHEVAVTGCGVQRLVRRQQHLSLGGGDDDDDLGWGLTGITEVLDVVRRGEFAASVGDRVVGEIEGALAVDESDVQIRHGFSPIIDDTAVYEPLLRPWSSRIRPTRSDVVNLSCDGGEIRASFFQCEHARMLRPELGLETAARRIEAVDAGCGETREPVHECRVVVGEVRGDLVLKPVE